jgi:3',5'-nucleoside bisphosphate phosphatase
MIPMIPMTNLHADFHLHSTASDGTLSPADLVAHAAKHGVQMLALTDHDTTQGCDAAARACAALGIRFIAGCELSASWRGQAVHVIGLWPGNATQAPDYPLQQHMAGVRQRRRERVQEIGARLARRAHLDGAALSQQVLDASAVPTRAHVARQLVAAGHAIDVQDAFDRYLGRGQAGHVPVEWPDLPQTLAAIRAAGALPVLAHPHRYKLSAGALRNLLGEFRDGGGSAMEISVGGMARSDLDRLATLARRIGLAGSAGSDFHDPAVPWNPPGRFAKLPADIAPIAQLV